MTGARSADSHGPTDGVEVRASRQPRPAGLRPLVWLALASVWVALLSFGLRQRFVHATTAGSVGTTPEEFPAASRLAHGAKHSTLLMFVHPQCPCTRASLRELAALLANNPHVTTQLVVAPTLDAQQSWADSPSAAIARDIPGLTMFEDRDAAEAARFGAQTSGYAVLYDAAGKLRFAGGITGSRGHVGENMGLAELREQLAHHAGEARKHAVYGCSLQAAGERTTR